MKYFPVIICLAVLAYLAYPLLIAFWKKLREPAKPFWLRYKPTGKVLYFPPHYESKAVEELLNGLKQIPTHVPFSSPDFERLESPPTEN